MIYASLQCQFTLFILNFHSKHRKEFYANKLYLIYFTCIFMYTILLITYKSQTLKFFNTYLVFLKPNNLESNEINELNRLVTLVFLFSNAMVSLMFEQLVNLLFREKKTKK